MEYRPLTQSEIDLLEQHGCTSTEWQRVEISHHEACERWHNVHFSGSCRIGNAHLYNTRLCDVTIADGSMVMNIGVAVNRCDIGEGAVVRNVGRIDTTPECNYGQGNAISVMSEAGPYNVMLHTALNADNALDMTQCAHIPSTPRRTTIGRDAIVENAREVTDAFIGDSCVIDGADRVCQSTLITENDYPPSRIGVGAIVEHSIISNGSVADNHSIVRRCFVGECSTLTDGATASDSLFFVNSFIACGEVIASFCGPFTVSHHKSTLLIGGKYAFFNAGSGTNFSNHAYKLGPLHCGELMRGCKTASSAHIIWPAQIGCFTMCMGKIDTHPDTRLLPFSYIIGLGNGEVRCIPGRQVGSCGLFRDVRKWPQRDQRPEGNRPTTVDYNWLTDEVVEQIEAGLKLLCSWHGDTVYNGVTIRQRDIGKGIHYYDLLLRMHGGDRDAAAAWAEIISDDARKECHDAHLSDAILDSFITDVDNWLEQYRQ